MEHPLHSLDLALCDFWLFPALKKALRKWQFRSDRELLIATQIFFNHLPESQFHKTFEEKMARTHAKLHFELSLLF